MPIVARYNVCAVLFVTIATYTKSVLCAVIAICIIMICWTLMKEFAFSIDLSEKETPLTNCPNSSGKSYAHLWTTLVNYIRRERNKH